ncbi:MULTISPECIES: GNAT family N-acetyltransferase [Streptomyces]|jgi:GNAT superfamily N-acetyltransferase|uniref:GNAT family N-acetyltransferase n=1 Tax=Streptomyces griseoaurantiacus TaxID=68213 RepID=A0A7W2HTU7_9ACTN|nr:MULTISPECIES: GNAT family N-acetyltransferase [Streptomyces]MBA5221303.1 GNAT family N-acetyltransferase [Streptomyces griseoaurantiacus]
MSSDPSVTVHRLRPDASEDCEAFARIREEALPFILMTGEALAHDLLHSPPEAHYEPLLARVDGEAVGSAQVGLVHDSPQPGQAYLNIYVRPSHEGRGAGTALVRAAEKRLREVGARDVYSWVLDTPANRAFAERRGYRPGRSAHFLRLDLTEGSLPPLQSAPPGVEVIPGTDFVSDPRPLFALDAETMADEPSDIDYELTDYESWLRGTWNHPLTSKELTSVVLVEGRPAAFTMVRTNSGTRYGTMMTGTARAYRGGGLAKLAKNDSLHRARAAGFTEALTGNDDGNGPMLAINKWFGYEICGTEVHHVRAFG